MNSRISWLVKTGRENGGSSLASQAKSMECHIVFPRLEEHSQLIFPSEESYRHHLPPEDKSCYGGTNFRGKINRWLARLQPQENFPLVEEADKNENEYAGQDRHGQIACALSKMLIQPAADITTDKPSGNLSKIHKLNG